jgi:hypothetical protein
MLSSRTLVILAALAGAVTLRAQDTTAAPDGSLGQLSVVNRDWERYWRVLQLDGTVPAGQWSIRALGPHEIDRLRATRTHPWSGRERSKEWELGFGRIGTVPLDFRIIANSAFPYGFNEGPVWAGRGVTTVIQGGAWLRAGPLTASFAPVAFGSQNADFAMHPNGYSGNFAFGFPYTDRIDNPQRFGDGTYSRVDFGNSFARLDAGIVALGFSTAGQQWGPARDQAPVIGTNAGGFPHVFLGSSRPVRLGPVRVHGKLVWGRLSQTPYSVMELVAPHRLAAGVVGHVSPVGVPGLELGVSRFAQMKWTGDVMTLENLFRPFGRTFGDGITDPNGVQNPENQIASVFGRWLFQESGVEVYGEFVLEDGALAMRNLTLEPDHDAGYVLGLQRGWSAGADGSRRRVVRGEILNTRMTSVRLIPHEVPFYEHNNLRQGHTHRGLVLGAAGGYGGGATSLAFDDYSPRGRTTFAYNRLMRAQFVVQGVPQVSRADVFHALGVEGIVFRGRSAITYELTGVFEANRHFDRDAFNVRAGLGTRYTW